MNRWAIERRWRLHSEADPHGECATGDLVGRAVCCLLGSAGIGKTFELRHLEELEQNSGYEAQYVRLGEVAISADRLTASLNSLSGELTGRSAIYLDAVDEAMVPVATTSQILADWIGSELTRTRPLLRVSCRAAIWPRAVQTAIVHVYGADSVTLARVSYLSSGRFSTHLV